MSVIFKLIKTPTHFYIYDRSRNAILEIQEDEYSDFNKIEKGLINAEDLKILEKYQSHDFLMENSVEKIEHPCNKSIDHYLENHLETLILQVTQKCNLRCEYCIYSGNYDNRSHSDLDMDYITAKKAIDLYLTSSNELDELSIGFYGGEPLINIGLVEKCVNYISGKVTGKNITYSLTTNGTLFNDKIVEYLVKNNFSIMISVDGSQKEHDEYRKFQNGKGSFEVIQKNLRKIKKNYPEFYQKITFNSVLNPKNNYGNIKGYFENDELIADSDVFTNVVESVDLTQDVKFTKEFKIINEFDYFKLYLFMLNKLDVEDISKLVLLKRKFIYERYNRIIKKNKLGSTCHHSGPCIPGTRRLFVNVQGNMYPCERVSESSPTMRIGDVNNGFNIPNIENLLNVGRITEDQCKNCWALLHCDQCAQKADGNDHLSKKLKIQHCPKSRKQAFFDLKEICILKEFGCTFER